LAEPIAVFLKIKVRVQCGQAQQIYAQVKQANKLYMKTRFFLTIAIIVQVHLSYSQWVQTDGPYGNTNVLSIIPHDSLLLTATDCGFFSKNQLMDRWMLNSPLQFLCYTKKGDSLFVGTLYEGIKLIDLNNPDSPVVDIDEIEVNTLANSDSCLYAGSKKKGFFKSGNNGTMWNAYNTGLPSDSLWNPWVGTYYETTVTDIEVSNNFIYCGTKKGVYRNTANLNNWTGINSGLPLSLVTLIKEIDNTLFTVVGNSLYKSENFGNNWTLVYTAPSNITSILKYNNGMYISTMSNGIYYATGNLAIWNSINSGLTDLGINALEIFDTTLICGTKTKGVFYYQNGQWISNKAGMICSMIRSTSNTNNHLFTNDLDKVYKLNTSGNWTEISPIVPFDVFGSLSSMNDTVFLSIEHDTVTWPNDIPFILYSADNGNSWHHLINKVPYAGDDPYRIYCDNGRLYTYEDDKIFYTSNLGLSWTDISLPTQYCNNLNAFIINNSVPFAAACGLGEVVKLDNTQNWMLSNNGLSSEPLAFASCDNALFAYIGFREMYVSFDKGNNWTYANNGLTASYSIRDFASQGTKLFVTSDKGVFATNDFGQHWIEINDGLKNPDASSIKILNDTLYVGTNSNGIWKRSLSDIAFNIPAFQQSGGIFSIYPNPASDYIRIASNAKEVKFKIIDMLGNEILAGNLNYSKEINISGINRGVYIVYMYFDNKVQTAKFSISR